MLYVPKWKIFFSVAVCLLAIITVIPNFNSNSGKNKINLGLDLRGGAYLLLEIDHQTYFQDKMEILKNEIRTQLRSSQVNYMNMRIDGDQIKLSLAETEEKLQNILTSLREDINIKEDEENISISYTDLFIRDQKTKLLEQSLEIVRRRIDETGTKELLIQPQGLDRIILQVPGIKNPERLKSILGKTAKMSFHMLHPEKPIVEDIFYVPSGYKILLSDEDLEDSAYYLVNETPEITGESLSDAQATIIQGKSQVNFKFDNFGARKFAEITSNNVGKRLAIILDDKVISAPVIREPILAGQGVISGDYTIQTASDLALLLRAGSLPAPLNIIEERTVGPTLGTDSISAGKKAVAIGFVLVLLLMAIIYKRLGMFAIVSLMMNIVFIFSILTTLGATLTLPGIAGIVLTIGMAVDTNVLIFERIREESKTGKSIYAVIDQGFSQAFKTIIDSNTTTLLVAIILFYFGSGPVKGFAVTLSAGILASMFSAIFLTKIFIYSWVKLYKPKEIVI